MSWTAAKGADLTRFHSNFNRHAHPSILWPVRLNEVIAGRFRLDSEEGAGGMGRVYRGRDLQTGLSVAVKVLKLRSGIEVDRFSREAALLAQVSHPGIVRYLAHGNTEDGQYLVMEWIDGETLKDRLVRQGLTIVESVQSAQQIAEALSEIHARGIIHRDIKPGNLMFVGGTVERVKILDFGIARRSDDLIGLTHTGFMVGSPGYMAPEQARGDRSALDHRVDLFALGCVLYECLTGRPPFFGDPVSVRAKILLSDPPLVRDLNADVSLELAALVEQLLSKDQGRRPLDAAQLAHQLAELREVPGERHKEESEILESAVTVALRPPRWANSDQAQQGVFTFLLAAGADSPEAAQTLAQRDLLSMVASYGGRVENVDGRWCLILFSGLQDPSQLAAQAARCALQLRALLPTSPMTLVSEPSTAGPDSLIDRAITSVTSETVASLFSETLPSPAQGDGIRLDEAMAGLLTPTFRVQRGGGTAYLRSQGTAGRHPG
ncbi:MAG TPA: serine/threonine-protein kinase [Myxococcaceae bacterium]|nr:serine/threonine-protein kinase [Myxococcaceae bacterium]